MVPAAECPATYQCSVASLLNDNRHEVARLRALRLPVLWTVVAGLALLQLHDPVSATLTQPATHVALSVAPVVAAVVTLFMIFLAEPITAAGAVRA